MLWETLKDVVLVAVFQSSFPKREGVRGYRGSLISLENTQNGTGNRQWSDRAAGLRFVFQIQNLFFLNI